MMKHFIDRWNRVLRELLEVDLVGLLKRPVVRVHHPFRANEPQPEIKLKTKLNIIC
jgi:hypothetical protein